MMAPTKNRTRPTAAAVPISGTRMPINSPSAPPASIGDIVLLGETWRTGDRPVETTVSHDFFHGERIAHVISEDETDNPIGNSREMRSSRENDQPLHA